MKTKLLVIGAVALAASSLLAACVEAEFVFPAVGCQLTPEGRARRAGNIRGAIYKLSVGSGEACMATMSSPENAAAPERRPRASSAEMRATSGLLLFSERCARTT